MKMNTLALALSLLPMLLVCGKADKGSRAQQDEGQILQVTATSLRIRKGPGVGHPTLITVPRGVLLRTSGSPKGTTETHSGKQGRWAAVLQGYAFTGFLKDVTKVYRVGPIYGSTMGGCEESKDRKWLSCSASDKEAKYSLANLKHYLYTYQDCSGARATQVVNIRGELPPHGALINDLYTLILVRADNSVYQIDRGNELYECQ